MMSVQEKIYRYFEQYSDLHVLFVFCAHRAWHRVMHRASYRVMYQLG